MTTNEIAVTNAKKTLKAGDRVGCVKCPGTKRVFTFSHFDGAWMVSKTHINDFHPASVYSVNGNQIDFKKTN